LHYNSPLKLRNLLILRYAQYAKIAQYANRRYTAGTRNTSTPMLPACLQHGQTLKPGLDYVTWKFWDL
jgi:hypothetical protein